MALTELTFLPTDGGMSDKEFVLARGVLELGAQWSIKNDQAPEEKMASFERYMAQLKAYYFDYRSEREDEEIRLRKGEWMYTEVNKT